MQLYLQKAALEEMGIYHFDSWAANFGEVTTALELTVEGSGFRFKSRFNKFTTVSYTHLVCECNAEIVQGYDFGLWV